MKRSFRKKKRSALMKLDRKIARELKNTRKLR